MKKLLLATTVLFLALGAQAADEMRTIIKCQPLFARPDLGMSATITQGGIAGLTQLTIKRYYLGHSSTHTYIVKQQPIDRRMMGSPVVFSSRDISLSINFTTTPLKDHGHHAVLSTLQPNDGFSNEELSCAAISNVYNETN